MFRWASPPPPVVSPWLLLGSSSLRGFVRLFLQCCSPLWRTHENLRTVRVDGLKFEYQLTEDDVRKVCHPPCQAYDSCKGFELASQSWFWEVFSRYGDVVLVKMDREGTTSQATCEAARSRIYIYIYLSIYLYIHTHTCFHAVLLLLVLVYQVQFAQPHQAMAAQHDLDKKQLAGEAALA